MKALRGYISYIKLIWKPGNCKLKTCLVYTPKDIIKEIKHAYDVPGAAQAHHVIEVTIKRKGMIGQGWKNKSVQAPYRHHGGLRPGVTQEGVVGTAAARGDLAT